MSPDTGDVTTLQGLITDIEGHLAWSPQRHRDHSRRRVAGAVGYRSNEVVVNKRNGRKMCTSHFASRPSRILFNWWPEAFISSNHDGLSAITLVSPEPASVGSCEVANSLLIAAWVSTSPFRTPPFWGMESAP